MIMSADKYFIILRLSNKYLKSKMAAIKSYRNHYVYPEMVPLKMLYIWTGASSTDSVELNSLLWTWLHAYILVQ